MASGRVPNIYEMTLMVVPRKKTVNNSGWGWIHWKHPPCNKRAEVAKALKPQIWQGLRGYYLATSASHPNSILFPRLPDHLLWAFLVCIKTARLYGIIVVFTLSCAT